ncbi:hypothetical protein PFICI_11168 [Pestalotiopsis fici W106-1]|uniref:Uncharacterized protein n=1 Tax=Pestalotiopsis fici (strain W106-1 / CGMCC3.15140) TaxID=1229662 RepID=W3WU30_PESFW|nr:uncharacterized protein PFICI_11168 [Pestalotiopsis fici W106-1]ETS77294.1 hypothetical protein PFICI_11168 [Pestalotiopsis fici W106-1]
MAASSRESTATLRQESQGTLYQDIAPDEVSVELLNDDSDHPSSRRLIIAVDFGTTFSCVSYVALEEDDATEYLPLDRIKTIQNYPNDFDNNNDDPMSKQVPTEILYTLNQTCRDTSRADNPSSEERMDDLTNEENSSSSDAPVSPMDVDEEGNDVSMGWGYDVHDDRRTSAVHNDPNKKLLNRFKLLLDQSPDTDYIRAELRETLTLLKKKKIIKGPLQVIADFLTCLLQHTKSELLQEGFDDNWRKEMVLCVPAIWSQKACRDMQTAMAIAMERTNFGGVDAQNNSIENLFIVSEPEAAATYVLASDPDIQAGDTFVLLDAGGGTVDANTYTISRTTPLRLTREVVEPGGGLYGSSYLNEGFKRLLHDILKDEEYLEDAHERDNSRETIEGIIEKITINEFEYRIKRNFNIYDSRINKWRRKFDVSSRLRHNPVKHFSHGGMELPMITIKGLFRTLLEGIATVMEDQINRALQKGCRVEKVILQGGFAASKSLQEFIRRRLADLTQRTGHTIKLTKSPSSANTITAVASGAVLRAFNKEQGPRRLARSSYGILRTEPFGDYPDEHKGVKPSYDRHDGLPYVKRTIDWVLSMGSEVPPIWTCRPFLCFHTFDCWPVRDLICKEELYVIDRAPRSHYRLSHEMNQGAEKVGEIVVDFTFLRDQGLIQPIEPVANPNGRIVGTRHYKVNYTMVIRVVDRDLQCYAIYSGRVHKRCRINIASAFRPGVK